jgi:hypothetical protein
VSESEVAMLLQEIEETHTAAKNGMNGLRADIDFWKQVPGVDVLPIKEKRDRV